MVEYYSIKAHNIYPNFNDQKKFRLNKNNEVKDYFIAQLKERELMSKWFSKNIVSVDYFDKSFIVLPEASDSISIASFVTVIRAPVGVASAIFSLAFSMSTRIVKKQQKQ